MQVQVASR